MQQWLCDPITVKVMTLLRGVRSEHQEVLLNGGTLTVASAEQTALNTALLLGKISGLNMVLEIEVKGD